MLYNDDQIGTENIFNKISADFEQKLSDHEQAKEKPESKVPEPALKQIPPEDENFKQEAQKNAQVLYDLLSLSEMYFVKLKPQLAKTRFSVSIKSEKPNEYLEKIRNQKKIIKDFLEDEYIKVDSLSKQIYDSVDSNPRVSIKDFFRTENDIMTMLLWFMIYCNWQGGHKGHKPCPPIMPLPPFLPFPPKHHPHPFPPIRPHHSPCGPGYSHHTHAGYPCRDPLCPRIFEQMSIEHLEIQSYIQDIM